MFVMLRKMIIKAGYEEQVISRFKSEGLIEKQDGFIDLSVLEEKSRKDEKEIVIIIRWESEDHWKQWEKSDAHIAGHKANIGKPKPDYLISQEVKKYKVKAVKNNTSNQWYE
ncbi:antibiotic biosynthesis monooxygenase family protein [Niallia sp. Krafla_26]|uniref:antibiotic biosynthesis monooxygenase family protein n=1 Tax=Niallia sp. Krafla_26 TaxID=3064703 RepID=UPI003D16C0E4